MKMKPVAKALFDKEREALGNLGELPSCFLENPVEDEQDAIISGLLPEDVASWSSMVKMSEKIAEAAENLDRLLEGLEIARNEFYTNIGDKYEDVRLHRPRGISIRTTEEGELVLTRPK